MKDKVAVKKMIKGVEKMMMTIKEEGDTHHQKKEKEDIDQGQKKEKIIDNISNY